MKVTVHVYEVKDATKPGEEPPAPKRIMEKGVGAKDIDDAKKKARELLKDSGFWVKSLNWLAIEEPTIAVYVRRGAKPKAPIVPGWRYRRPPA